MGSSLTDSGTSVVPELHIQGDERVGKYKREMIIE